MRWSRREMLERFNARDRTADGEFVTGVRSTGIYCLPSCPARKPKPENVEFFARPDEAEGAGFRPCLRCRPEEFYAGRDPELERFERCLAEIEAAPGDFPSTASVGAAMGYGRSSLAAAFRRHLHQAPAEALRRARVRWARRQLLETDRRVLDIGLDAGFESASAFHAAFRRHVGTTPGGYRDLRHGDRFHVSLPRGFRRADTLRYLARDPESPTERAEGLRIGRALLLDGEAARLSIDLEGDDVDCRLDSPRPLSTPARAAAHEVVRRWLGLDGTARPSCGAGCGGREWARLLEARPGLRVLRTPTVFEALAWAVVGQQVSMAFAYQLRRTLVELAGERLGPWLTCHPEPASVAALDPSDLTARKFSRAKAETLVEVSRRVVAGELDLEALANGATGRAERTLLAQRGVGPWTAGYVMLRGCGFEDAVPVGDAGLRRALTRFFDLSRPPDRPAMDRLLEPFAPHRGLATFHLWASLGDPP